jgi:hypothetical protein
MYRLALLLSLVACRGGDATEHYAVGTYLFTGSVMTGSTGCTFDAPAGTLDGSLILKPGAITEKCPKGDNKIVAEYADHVALTFAKTAKVGDEVYLSFELRNKDDVQLTPTLSQMGDTRLGDGCTALADLERHGAQDTGHSPFMSATASAPGTCKVTVDIELPAASGKQTLHAEQTVTVK